ncbi:MAG: hypothetical protein LDL11_04315 [Desulfarculus sp.]|nr:hypothetical protein [Desulfarculus sp.]
MPSVIVLAGPAGADKTAWIEQLVADLARRGRRVLVVSAPPAPAPPLPPAGAAAWLELGSAGYQLRCSTAQTPSLDEILIRHLAGFDLIISELAPSFAAPVLEWLPSGVAPSLAGDPNLKAVVGAGAVTAGVPVLGPEQVDQTAELILALTAAPEHRAARLLVDGRRVYIKDFVQDILAGAVRGMVETLKGGGQAGRIELHLYQR